jgi:hypothetical protein
MVGLYIILKGWATMRVWREASPVVAAKII